MKRRSFLKNTSLLSLPIMLSGIPVSSYSRSRYTQFFESDDDRVLVLIQLNGGNDGLGTIIPVDQYEYLTELRSNIILPESSLVKITDEVALHPSFGSMKNIFDERKMSIIQSVAYPNQNRSHFRSTDIWHTASEADEFLDEGWLGRFLYQDHPMYPDNYPNNDFPDPIAITMGLQVSETCQGPVANYSIALNGEDSLTAINETEGNEEDMTCYGREVSFIRETIKQLNAYSEVVSDAFEGGSNSIEYPEGNDLANQLSLVAKLISGGLKTKVYVVSIGGFDTHANQVDISDPREGVHANLLKNLSEAISSFQEDLDAQGLSERVVGMTYSEFGRRIRSNGSLGTDHGTAAPLILFGNCVNGEIIGTNPNLEGDIDQNEGVPMQYDFRSVYASVLMDWFGAEETELRNILYQNFQYIPLINGCESTSVIDETISGSDILLYPNPCHDFLQVRMDSFFTSGTIEIYNIYGYLVYRKIIENHDISDVKIPTHSFLPGNYSIRIIKGTNNLVKRFIKV